MFKVYLELGIDHILDLNGYDHMLFIITLCAVYAFSEWKKVLVLVTAFTVGHSITLALASLNIFSLNADLVELLIPVTILLTALHNVLAYKSTGSSFGKADWTHYALALGFGFIHGMGFSNFFRALLGSEESIFVPLLGFNIGLELGQLLIVVVFFMLYWGINAVRKVQQRSWNLFFSGAGAGIALVMIIEKLLDM